MDECGSYKLRHISNGFAEVILQPLTFTAPASELSEELSLLLSLLLSESDPELLLLSPVCDG